jgi:hypothetical protein
VPSGQTEMLLDCNQGWLRAAGGPERQSGALNVLFFLHQGKHMRCSKHATSESWTSEGEDTVSCCVR